MSLCLAVMLYPYFAVTHAMSNAWMPEPQNYRSLIGKRVVLEGIVWDSLPGWHGRVQMPSGEQVFIENGARRPWEGRRGREAIDGKMIRVVGVLTYKMGNLRKPLFTPVAGITIAQPAYLPNYFSLQMESFEVIDRAQLGRPELAPLR